MEIDIAFRTPQNTFHTAPGNTFCRVVFLSDLCRCEKENTSSFPKLRVAVNAVNCYEGPTVLLTDPDKNGIVCVHSKKGIILHICIYA